MVEHSLHERLPGAEGASLTRVLEQRLVYYWTAVDLRS